MPQQGSYTIKRNTRQVRSPMKKPVEVETNIELPEGVHLKLYNINLGGMGLALPLNIDPLISKEGNIRRNNVKLDVEVGDELSIFIPEGEIFKRDLRVTGVVRFIAQAQKVYNVPCIYYFGLSFKKLSNRAFSTIESVLIRL